MNPYGSSIRPTSDDWKYCEEALTSFENGLRSGNSPVIHEYLSRFPTGSRLYGLQELVKLDLEYRWQHGEKILIEEYAIRYPELRDNSDLWRELFHTEMRLRRQSGCDLRHDEIVQRFPKFIADGAARSKEFRSLPAKELRPGSRLGRYELLEVLGRGGFATVYRAWDTELRRDVAVKIPHAEFASHEELLARVLREVQSAARMHHPSIVPVFEIGQQDHLPFIVYEFISGETLAEHLNSHRPTTQQAARWVADLASALHYAHQCGIVHRDVKPANILMAKSLAAAPGADDLRPMLFDFGLALHSTEATMLTREGDILGTPAYMSPEQAKGFGHQASARSDVYSLGVVLYQLVSGVLPFNGSGASVLHHVIHDEPPNPRSLRAGLALDLATICLKAMAKEPERRYATAGEFADDLYRYLRSEPIRATRTGVIRRCVRWCRRNPAVTGTILAASLLLTVVGGASYLGILQERNRFLAERETAVARLYDSLVREAEAVRLARAPGYRAIAWDRLRQARKLETTARDLDQLRREATASLGDFVGLEPRTWLRPAELHGWTSAITVSPTGNLIAVAFTDVIQLRDAHTGGVVAEFRDHQSGVYALAFSSDGQTLATMDDSGVIKVRRSKSTDSGQLDSWTIVLELQGLVGVERQNIVAVSCGLTPDGQHVFACSKGEQRVRLWSVETAELEFEFRGPQHEPFVRASLSPDGSLLVGAYRTAEIDGVVIWDVARREIVKTLPVSRQAIVDVSFNADMRFLACACEEGTFVFDTNNWQQRTIIRSEDQFFTVAFHPTQPILAVPSSGLHSVRLWDVMANREVATLKQAGAPHSVTFAPDGSFLVVATNDAIQVWNLLGSGEKRELAAHRGVVNHVKFSPNGRLLATAGSDTRVRLWDTSTWKLLSEFSLSPTALGKVQRIAFSPEGRRLAAVDWAGSAAIFDIGSPAFPDLVQTLLSHEQPDLGQILWDIDFSPDGEHLAIAGQNGVGLWHGDQWVAKLTKNAASILQFTPDGRRILWREAADASVRVWNLQTASEEQILNSIRVVGGFDMVDAHHMVHVAGRQESDKGPILHLTDLNTGVATHVDWKDIPQFFREVGIGTGLKLTRDSSLLAIEGGNFSIWNLRTKQLQWVLPAEANPSHSFDWNPDGSLLAIGLTDGSVSIWHPAIVQRQLDLLGFAWE